MRIDLFLVNKGYFESRSKAEYAISLNQVLVNGKIVTKNSTEVNENDLIQILPNTLKYVSKGGLKLEKALDYFHIDIQNKVCLDIGASTGGFTDCLLKHGASLVYAIDVGRDQLHPSLKTDKRVYSFEETNFLSFDLNKLPHIDCITIDVSFVKVETILDRVINSFKDLIVIFLIKPQFELGHIYIKNGVVKDQSLQMKVINQIQNYLKDKNIQINPMIESPIKGGSGNTEYLTFIKI